MFGLTNIIQEVQRSFVTLCLLGLLVPLIMLMLTIGAAEWINQIYSALYGWFAVAGAYSLGLIFMVGAIWFKNHETTASTEQLGDPVDEDHRENTDHAQHNLALDDLDFNELIALLDDQVQNRPLSTMTVLTVAGAVAGTNPELIEKIAIKFAA